MNKFFLGLVAFCCVDLEAHVDRPRQSDPVGERLPVGIANQNDEVAQAAWDLSQNVNRPEMPPELMEAILRRLPRS